MIFCACLAALVAGSTGNSFAQAPTVSSISPNSATVSEHITITGTNFIGVTAVRFGSALANSSHVNSDTSITAQVPAGIGTVDVTVTTAGGTSAISAADQFTYLAAPTVTSISPNSGPSAGGTSVTITGTGFGLSVAFVTFGGNGATFIVNSATSITAISPPGTGTVDVRVSTNRTSATSAADQFTYSATAPAITSISPDRGPPAGGTSVTITGANFTGATAVKFGAANAATFTVNNATSITATSPSGTGTVDVTVTTPGGTSPTSAADQFTYGAGALAPTVTSISPNSATISEHITITGTNFIGVTAVRFGSALATSSYVNSDTSITAQVPAGIGTVDVTVTTAGGTSAISAADQFTYLAAPTVTSISPNSGPSAGGTSVTITGTGFGLSVAFVTFGGEWGHFHRQ